MFLLKHWRIRPPCYAFDTNRHRLYILSFRMILYLPYRWLDLDGPLLDEHWRLLRFRCCPLPPGVGG